MINKQIEVIREIRFWFAQVIIPAVITGAFIMRNSNVRYVITENANGIKSSIKNNLKEY